MLRVFKKRSKTAGLPPGTLIYTGKKRTGKVRITVIDYDDKQVKQKEVQTIEESFPFKNRPTVTWINIDGLHGVDNIEKIGMGLSCSCD